MPKRNRRSRLVATALIAASALAVLPAAATPTVASDETTPRFDHAHTWQWVSDAWHALTTFVSGDGEDATGGEIAGDPILDDPSYATTDPGSSGGEQGGAMDPNG